MIMRMDFLIRPNGRFLHKLEASSADLAEVFKANVIWSYHHSCRSLWEINEIVDCVKTLWLGSLEEYVQDKDFRELLGELQFDKTYFDQHWEIHRVEWDDDVSSVIGTLPKALLEKLVNANPSLNDWIKSISSPSA